jgi:hypothetical protein
VEGRDVADVRPQPSVTNPVGTPYSRRSRSGRLPLSNRRAWRGPSAGRSLSQPRGHVEARAGTVEADESGRTLGILAVTAAEAIPTEGEVLGARAGIILDSADGGGRAGCKPSGGAAGSRG